MQFESKVKRMFWMSALLGFIPNILIAVALAAIFDGGFVGFLFAFIGLQIVYLLVWIKNSVWGWVLFSLGGRKKLAAFLRDYLRENRYPEPGTYQSSVEEYLSGVASDETQPVNLRLKAAGDLAAFNYPATQGQLQQFMRLSMAYEDALEQHKSSFPVKSG